MNTGVISERYAKAFLEFCLENGSEDRVYSQVCKLLENDIPEKMEDDLDKLISLLVKNDRLSFLKYILANYVLMYRRHKGLIEAKLTIAHPQDGLEDKIGKAISDKFSGKIVFKEKVDPALIDGFILEIDGKVMDTSIKTKLDEIRRSFDDMNKRLV